MVGTRVDELDPLSYFDGWPSLRSATGRVDVHSLIAFWIKESKIKGDYYEFGVGQGRSAVAAIRAARKYDLKYKFHLFDSFQGLPELVGRDADSSQFHEGQFAYSKENVRSFIENHCGFDIEFVNFHKVWFSDLVSTPGSGYAAVVHIDCDLYRSALEALRFVTHKLTNGSVILFDDFNAFSASDIHGERLALDEWISSISRDKTEGRRSREIILTEYVSYGWHGKGFICRWS